MPGVPAGTTIVETFPSLAPSSRAATRITDVIDVPEFVMNALDPSMTHSSPSSRAVVRTARASEPPPGSVSANAPIASPRAIGTSHPCFCSSVPKRWIGFAARPTAASSVMATEESHLAISSRQRQNVSRSPPCPPYPSGNGMPNSPSSPIRFTTSSGNSSRSSYPAAAGATTSSANSRTSCWKLRCSSVRSKSTASTIAVAGAGPAWEDCGMSSTEALEERLATGREAVARRSWPEAYEALHGADAGTELGPDDLELLAKAAWWVGRPAESIAVRERAYAKFLERGDKQGAAFTALTLRRQYRMKNAGSVAQGWLNRAERLLEGEPESISQGYLALAHGQLEWSTGELEDALPYFERGAEIADRIRNEDLRAWAAMYRGMVLVSLGRVDEGWALLEEVSAAAVGGELGAHTTGSVF